MPITDGVTAALPAGGETERSFVTEPDLGNTVDISAGGVSSIDGANAAVLSTPSSPATSLTSLLSHLMLGQTTTLDSPSDTDRDDLGSSNGVAGSNASKSISDHVISKESGSSTVGNAGSLDLGGSGLGATRAASQVDGTTLVVTPASSVTLAQKRRQIVYMFQLFCCILIGLIVIHYSGHEHGRVVLTITLGLTVALACYFSPKVAYLWLDTAQKCSSFDKALRKADTRNAPVLEMQIEQGENNDLRYGFSCMQGWRRTMEDDHTLQLFDGGGFFGIYDGHSGAGVANFCGQNMYRFITSTNSFMQGNVKKALYEGFIALDRYLHGVPESERERSGCTAVVLYVKDDELYCANAGDSRCILCRNGKAFALSIDHKPYLPHEQSRIEKAGGYVINRRVNGVLALSRAIGDFVFKTNSSMDWEKQAVTSAPDVHMVRLDREKDEFAVVACDGIWDVMTSQAVADFVKQQLQQHMPLATIAEKLMMRCLSPHPFGLGCDNMSVTIVQFKRLPTRPTSESATAVVPSTAVSPHQTLSSLPSTAGASTTTAAMTMMMPATAAIANEGGVANAAAGPAANSSAMQSSPLDIVKRATSQSSRIKNNAAESQIMTSAPTTTTSTTTTAAASATTATADTSTQNTPSEADVPFIGRAVLPSNDLIRTPPRATLRKEKHDSAGQVDVAAVSSSEAMSAYTSSSVDAMEATTTRKKSSWLNGLTARMLSSSPPAVTTTTEMMPVGDTLPTVRSDESKSRAMMTQGDASAAATTAAADATTSSIGKWSSSAATNPDKSMRRMGTYKHSHKMTSLTNGTNSHPYNGSIVGDTNLYGNNTAARVTSGVELPTDAPFIGIANNNSSDTPSHPGARNSNMSVYVTTNEDSRGSNNKQPNTSTTTASNNTTANSNNANTGQSNGNSKQSVVDSLGRGRATQLESVKPLAFMHRRSSGGDGNTMDDSRTAGREGVGEKVPPPGSTSPLASDLTYTDEGVEAAEGNHFWNASHGLPRGMSRSNNPTATDGLVGDRRRARVGRGTPRTRVLRTSVEDHRDRALYATRSSTDTVRAEMELLRDSVNNELTQTIET